MITPIYYFVSILLFLVGLGIGSFINCLIYRLAEKKSILGRSFCPKCQHQLAWRDLFPIFSFLFSKGRCRYCQQKISWQYPIIETITGLLFLLAFFQFGCRLSTIDCQLLFLRNLIFVVTMVIVFVYDFKYMLVEDAVVVPAIIIIFFLNLLTGQSLSFVLIGGFLGWGFFFFQYVLTKKKGLGEGDLRLGILIGVMFGWPVLLTVLFFSYIIGGVFCLALIVSGKKKMFSQVPLGPFLAVGSLLTLFFRSEIINFYFNFIF